MVVIFFKCAFVNYCITVVDLYVVGKFIKTLTAMLKMSLFGTALYTSGSQERQPSCYSRILSIKLMTHLRR